MKLSELEMAIVFYCQWIPYNFALKVLT